MLYAIVDKKKVFYQIFIPDILFNDYSDLDFLI